MDASGSAAKAEVHLEEVVGNFQGRGDRGRGRLRDLLTIVGSSPDTWDLGDAQDPEAAVLLDLNQEGRRGPGRRVFPNLSGQCRSVGRLLHLHPAGLGWTATRSRMRTLAVCLSTHKERRTDDHEDDEHQRHGREVEGGAKQYHFVILGPSHVDDVAEEVHGIAHRRNA
jgi:hypothetical protein